MPYKGVIDRYEKALPPIPEKFRVTLHEGGTPLIEAPRLAGKLGLPAIRLFLKMEGFNPTGSFKDRGMTVAVSKALEEGSKAVITASTGNTSASAAAYAARAGMKCVVLVPDGKIARGKLSQAVVHGATVLSIRGNFDDALRLVKDISASYPFTMVNSLNPMRLEGQKTAAFEIVDDLGDAPDYQFMPVGNAGNISAYWMGYKEIAAKKKASRTPKMMGFQAEGAAPIVKGEPIKSPKTIATAIRIGNPASWKKAEAARDESGGLIDSVTDDEIMESYHLIAQTEGLFGEPASAAGVAGLKKVGKSGKIKFKKGDVVVCVVTGHGLKDPDTALLFTQEKAVLKPTMNSVLSHLGF